MNSAKVAILKTLFPDSLFTTTGVGTAAVNLDDIKTKTSKIIETAGKNIKLSSIAVRPRSNLLRGLIPTIPAVDTPSPAEMREYVAKKIEEFRRKNQEQVIKQLTSAAEIENKPFTARKASVNTELRKNHRG